MNEEVMGPLIFFTAVTLWIVLPIYYRNLLYRRTIDVVAKAIEHGIDPERVQFKLPQLKQDEGDVNGNWKASMILMSLGLAFTLLIALPMYSSGLIDGEDAPKFAIFLPGGMTFILGLTLWFIHRTIVGPVIKRGARPAQPEQ